MSGQVIVTYRPSTTLIYSVVYLSTACSKTAWSVGALCEHRQGDAFFIHWQQHRWSSVPDQSRLYQSFDFTNIPKLYLVYTLLHDSQTL